MFLNFNVKEFTKVLIHTYSRPFLILLDEDLDLEPTELSHNHQQISWASTESFLAESFYLILPYFTWRALCCFFKS